MEAGRRKLMPPPRCPSVTLSAYLQYAFIIDATRGLYCLMMPRFLSTASGLAARPAVSAVSASLSRVSSCLAMSQDLLFSACGSICGNLEQRGQTQQVVRRRAHLARGIRVLDREPEQLRRTREVLRLLEQLAPRGVQQGRRVLLRLGIAVLDRVLQERQRLLGPEGSPRLPRRIPGAPPRFVVSVVVGAAPAAGGALINAWAASSAGTMAVVSLAMMRLVTATTLSVWPVIAYALFR